MCKNKQNRFNRHHMLNAMNAATMSSSELAKVGVVIVKDNRTIINGWNGTISGADNRCEEYTVTCECGVVHIVELLNDDPSSCNYRSIDCSCTRVLTPNNTVPVIRTKLSVIHAEENAILYAAKTGISLNGSTLYSTYAPCIRCSRMIITCGIKKVYYLNEYKNSLGIDLLHDHGVSVMQSYVPCDLY